MKKFTILELLVVVAIMIILMSLLLPSLESARKKGREIACTGNLRETGIGVSFYAEEYSSYLPQSKWWTRCMEIGQGGAISVNCIRCPSSKPPEDTYYVTPIPNIIGYGMNIYMNTHKIQEFKYSSMTLVMADANLYQFDWFMWGTRIMPRHGLGANVLFLDGHVKWQNQENTVNKNKTMWTVSDTP